MSLSRKQLAQIATVKALQVRQRSNCAFWDPLCVYDLAAHLGLEVRFFDIPSMEGLYCASAKPGIIVSSLRPGGRQAFTCAHEIGHHVFGHGDQYDELVEHRSETRRLDPREFQADCFAGALLIPKVAVSRGFSLRSLDPPPPRRNRFTSSRPGSASGTPRSSTTCALPLACSRRPGRGGVAATPTAGASGQRFLAVSAGNTSLWRTSTVRGGRSTFKWATCCYCKLALKLEGGCAEVAEQRAAWLLARAVRPGISRVAATDSNWSAYIRVSRNGYSGRSMYRFLEEAEDDE